MPIYRNTPLPPDDYSRSSGPLGGVAGYLALAALALVAITLFLSYFMVDAGHVAVTKRFRAVREGVYYPGLNFKLPFIDTAEHVDIRLASVDAVADAASSDVQVVKAKVAVLYSLDPTLVPAMINNQGTRERFVKDVLTNAIQESVKAATAEYTAEQLITKRGEVKFKITRAIEQFVRDTLEKKGLPGLAPIANVAISDFDFSDGFNTSIEARVGAEVDKAKRITDAEAKNAEIKLAADAEAYRTKTEAESRAGAINAEGTALRNNPGLIQLRIAERWDGVLPRFNGGSLPLLTMDAGEIINRPDKAPPTNAASR